MAEGNGFARDTTYGLRPRGADAAPTSEQNITLDPASGGLGALSVEVAEDGSVTIGPSAKSQPADSGKFDANLAEGRDCADVAEYVLQGIESDIQSRSEFIQNYTKGLELLGLKIEDSTNVRGQKRNISRVNHPLLLEAIVRFQAQARAEMLPAAGPCKVSNIGGSTEAQDQLASAFETDMNYYLTQVDRGFYPDFDRGLFGLGYGGNLFKKVYRDPIRRMPTSRSVQVEDLIVSQDEADLDNALRVTHRIYMNRVVLKRMQLAKAYRDCDLGTPSFQVNPAKAKQNEILGMSNMPQRPQDAERQIYECHTDLDPEEWDLPKEKGCPEGMPLPYIVTIDESSRQVLAIRRNWKKGDPEWRKRRRFIHYGLIPSFDFLCLGFLHLLGNQTRALRAVWRILIDLGMFSSFPGGIKAKSMRTDTNEITPGPGEWVDIDLGPFDSIKDGLMPMPYKEPSPVFIQLAEIIGADAQRLGSVPEMEVGEGRTHVPVGTMMTLIEQATQTMASVHKRMHTAFADELGLLKELFSEDPSALSRLARNPARKWEVAEEFMSLNLAPASDPNVPAQASRNMQATAIVSLAGQAPPGLYDLRAVNLRALRSIGVTDAETLITPPQAAAAPPPDPAIEIKKQELALRQQELAFKQSDSQRKAAHELVENQQQDKHKQLELGLEQARLHFQDKQSQRESGLEKWKFAHDFAGDRLGEQHELRQGALTHVSQHLSKMEHAKHQAGHQKELEAMRAEAAKEAAAAKPKEPKAAKPKKKPKA